MWIEKVVRKGVPEDAGGTYFVQGLDACYVVKTFMSCQQHIYSSEKEYIGIEKALFRQKGRWQQYMKSDDGDYGEMVVKIHCSCAEKLWGNATGNVSIAHMVVLAR